MDLPPRPQRAGRDRARRGSPHVARPVKRASEGGDRLGNVLVSPVAKHEVPSRPRSWWGYGESNTRPHPYQGCALVAFLRKSTPSWSYAQQETEHPATQRANEHIPH